LPGNLDPMPAQTSTTALALDQYGTIAPPVGQAGRYVGDTITGVHTTRENRDEPWVDTTYRFTWDGTKWGAATHSDGWGGWIPA
jgi:hypothetical protein